MAHDKDDRYTDGGDFEWIVEKRITIYSLGQQKLL